MGHLEELILEFMWCVKIWVSIGAKVGGWS